MTPEERRIMEERKAAMLEVLGPFGFRDFNDDECPGGIWHSETAVCLDTARISEKDVIRCVYEIGARRGGDDARRKMHVALGL